MTQQPSQTTSRRVTKQGVVISDKMEKTIVVSVTERFQHPLYRKTVQKSKKYKAHDGRGKAKPGDLVEIESVRPISKEKSWKLAKIVRRSPQVI